MATTDERQKREKARRVWRLNKKEGIPVLEALDSVGISKDVYYRVKNEYEEKWENEITTAEELENKLEELQQRTEEYEDTLEEREERAEEAIKKLETLKHEQEWYGRIADMQDKMIRMENIMDQVDWRSKDINTGDFKTVGDRVDRLEGQMEELQETVEEIEENLNQVMRYTNQQHDTVEDLEHRISAVEARDPPESVFDLI